MPVMPPSKGSKWIVGENEDKIKEYQRVSPLVSSIARGNNLNASNMKYYAPDGGVPIGLQSNYQRGQSGGQIGGALGSIAASVLFPGGGLVAPLIGGALGNVVGQLVGGRGTGVDLRNVLGSGVAGAAGGAIGPGLSGAAAPIAAQFMAHGMYKNLYDPARNTYTPYYER